MKKINKRILASMMGAAMIMSLAACGSDTKDGSEGDVSSSVSGSVGPNVTDMKEGEVKETHKLSVVDYAEGEATVNPFYKKGTDENGNACYVVKDVDGNNLNLPLDGTVIYSMQDGESYAELVNISYKADGKDVSEDQWRIYVVNGGSQDDGPATDASSAAASTDTSAASSSAE